METREILQDIINDFEVDKFVRFFRDKSNKFAPKQENFAQYNDENFKDGKKLGEISFVETEQLAVFAFQASQPLSERSGKKAQYEKGKRILREQQYDAGIFIFYDAQGNFRFSLIYANYLGKKRDWSVFRRFTYFVSKEFTNKTFYQRIGDGDFGSLVKIKDAFSVEKVTQEFYESIANWYFWAVEHCQFPKDAKAEENGRNIAVIRLITRMIFIWFMRERGLMPKNLFEETGISAILKSISAEDSSYYTGILQNLFFATLSTKKEERQFGSEVRGYKGYNPDFGNQYVFRYQELFKNPDEIKKYFGNIPFLNGGLFECLDDKKNGIIIDGFSRTKKNQPTVPNFLFFSQEKKANLNKAYGTKNKTYKVRGLLDILSSFNFTIDENSPDDADVALDPELLGRVFENLLASFNPETSTTARKATGSYYTPREIVDYMVAESLKAYFRTHLEGIENIDEKLENLFFTGNQGNPFNQQEAKRIVGLIESVKIVDPAVGSGAFPMGALNKMVFILTKVDPGNELWEQAQLKAADAIPDPSVRREAKIRIGEFFKSKNADYGRKLYLIQRCIYGVDIQQIAVEIAKLRFFISLLVDEKIDRNKDNWGIEPLPNLDFKIMQGNSLISEFLGIDFDNGHEKQEEQGQVGLGFEQEGDVLIKEFEQKKIDYQNESDKDKKASFKAEVEDLMIRIFEKKLQKKYAELKPIENRAQNILDLKTRAEYIKIETAKVAKKHGFDLENIEKQLREFTSKKKNRPFFPWKLYFAEVFSEKGGFDIVIANPPYVSVKEISTKDKKIFSDVFETGQGRFNLFTLFLEKADQILKSQGVRTFILPEGLYSNIEYRYIRKHILENSSILFIILFSNRVFDAAVDTSIISTQKVKKADNQFPVIRDLKDCLTIIKQNLFNNFPANLFAVNLNDDSKKIIFKFFNTRGERIDSILEIQQGIIYSGQIKENVFSNNKTDNNYKKILDGRDILKWKINWDNKKENKYICYSDKLHRAREERLFIAKEKLLFPRRSTIICGTYDDQQYYVLNTAYVCLSKTKGCSLKSILAILNSRLINYFYSKLFFGWQITIPALNSIVIPEKYNQKSFIEIIDKILPITKSGDYLENPAKKEEVKEYEKQIDQMVYKLYNLTPEEIKIVENSSRK